MELLRHLALNGKLRGAWLRLLRSEVKQECPRHKFFPSASLGVAIVAKRKEKPKQMNPIPILETERLILRGWKNSDFDRYAQLMGHPEVTRFLPSGVMAPEEAWQHMAMIAGHWNLLGYGIWVIERKDDKVFLGRTGFWDPPGWPAMELIWTLDRPFWGNGYATEAARAAIEFGFTSLGAERVTSHIDVENTRSQQVAGRLGQSRTGKTEINYRGRRLPVEIWRIGRPQWLSK